MWKDFISDLKCMQISTRIATDENLMKEYPKTFDCVKSSPVFNKREKEEILKPLKRVNSNKSFKKSFIGFD